jgi:hypothetical protein
LDLKHDAEAAKQGDGNPGILTRNVLMTRLEERSLPAARRGPEDGASTVVKLTRRSDTSSGRIPKSASS